MKFSVMLEQLSSGMLKSMGIFFLTLLFSLPLGLLISFGRMSKNPVLRTVVNCTAILKASIYTYARAKSKYNGKQYYCTFIHNNHR